MAYRWFGRLGLEDRVPDHSTFAKNRHGRFRQSDALRFVFESVLKRCMTPDGHPNSPICGHLKFPHPGHGAMRR